MSNVVGTVMVVRGGDRLWQPMYYYQDQPSISAASLTPLGEAQEVDLGALLRSIYLDDSSPSFIHGFSGNASLYNSAQVTIRADATDTSGGLFESAVALGQGLWPPTAAENFQIANGSIIVSPLGGYQYTMVTPVDPSLDFTINGVLDCVNFWNRAQQLIATPPFLNANEQIQQLVPQLESFIPEGVFDYEFPVQDVGSIFDYINVQTIHNGTFAANFPPSLFEQVRSLNDFVASTVFTDTSPSGIGNAGGRSILYDITSALLGMSSPTNVVRMYIDVVDFEPFLSLMNITGMFEGGNLQPSLGDIPVFILHFPADVTLICFRALQLVDYASALVFELRNTSSSQYTVRVNFKNGTSDDTFHTLPVIFDEWNGSGGRDVPLATLTELMTSDGLDGWSPWCTACGSQAVVSGCILANLTGALTSTQSSSSSLPSSSSAVSVPEQDTASSSHSRISPVGAGFLGAGLTIVALSALFGFLLFLGVFSYGGVKKWRRFSNTSFRRDRKMRGDELELRSEANSVVGLKMP
ncbi:hypothetical protein NM688_g1744 [Phlebia brevispora]|uniref:Uncharacterized protein n=1 Tax=Phlebia brevispora TaxID=194682 RepID=A0ACC1TAW1_9APHY|nr:hypothetical protein NM688_g1744 [Phlebia brevispora]